MKDRKFSFFKSALEYQKWQCEVFQQGDGKLHLVIWTVPNPCHIEFNYL